MNYFESDILVTVWKTLVIQASVVSVFKALSYKTVCISVVIAFSAKMKLEFFKP